MSEMGFDGPEYPSMVEMCEFVGGYTGMTGREVFEMSPSGELWPVFEAYDFYRALQKNMRKETELTDEEISKLFSDVHKRARQTTEKL